MPVITNPMDSKVKIKYQVGVDGKGNPKFKTKTYSKIKSASTDEDVHAVAEAIANLQQNPVEDFTRVDEKEIEQA